MKIVVIGGSGLIGSKLVAKLGEHGHEAVAASPNTGVNTLTGEGLAEQVQRGTAEHHREPDAVPRLVGLGDQQVVADRRGDDPGDDR